MTSPSNEFEFSAESRFRDRSNASVNLKSPSRSHWKEYKEGLKSRRVKEWETEEVEIEMEWDAEAKKRESERQSQSSGQIGFFEMDLDFEEEESV